jgi:hypothetical protein
MSSVENEHDDSTVLEILETLLSTHNAAEENEIPIRISLTAEFIKDIIDELKNNITILSDSGELVCIIEEPLASQVTNSAVKKYVEEAIRNYLDGYQT